MAETLSLYVKETPGNSHLRENGSAFTSDNCSTTFGESRAMKQDFFLPN
jgi:hypothetical protein